MTKAKGKAQENKAPSFEQSLARLEKIVEKLDDGNLPLDDAIALFKEGTALAKICRDKLAEAEVQVKEALTASVGDAADPSDEDDELGDEDDIDEEE